MKKSFVVIGMGRFGHAVAKKLYELGHDVLAVDEDEHKINDIADYVTHAVIADAKDEKTLRSLGIRNYDCAVLAIGDDIADSTLITLGLKDLGVEKIICKARDIRHQKILQKIGADMVIIPELEAGIKLAIHIADRNLIDTISLSDKYDISEIFLPERWGNKTLMELDLRRRYNVTVVAVKKPGGNDDIVMAPGGDYRFIKGDIPVLIGDANDIAELGRKK